MTETRIVELCSAANVAEAHALCASLEDAGVRASIVGEFVGNAAGIGHMGAPVAPRVWVRDGDLERAREVLDERVRQRQQQASEDEPGDGGDAGEEPSEEPSCNVTRRLIRIGCWLGCGSACAVSSTGFVLMFCVSLHAAGNGNQSRELVESLFLSVICGALAVLTGLALKKSISSLRAW